MTENLENLMFRREHFPVVLHKAIRGERMFWDLGEIVIPPYHPSMAKNGINFRAVPELLYEVMEATVKDLEEIADKISDFQLYLQDVRRDEKSGRILFKPKIVKQYEGGIEIDDIPVVEHLWVGKKEINPYDCGGNKSITIDPEITDISLFEVPEGIVFSPELMREYEMVDGGESILAGMKEIRCPYGWRPHNLERIDAIFYRNLVIALDNSIVRKIRGANND